MTPTLPIPTKKYGVVDAGGPALGIGNRPIRSDDPGFAMEIARIATTLTGREHWAQTDDGQRIGQITLL